MEIPQEASARLDYRQSPDNSAAEELPNMVTLFINNTKTNNHGNTKNNNHQTLRIRFTPVGDTRLACKSVKFSRLLNDTVKMAEA